MKRKFSGGFTIVEFMLGCLILVIIVAGLASTLSYFSKSGVHLGANTRAGALAEKIRSDITAQTRGNEWHTMTPNVVNAADPNFPNLTYNVTVSDIQDNARRVLVEIFRHNSSTPELVKRDEFSVSPRPGSDKGTRIKLIARRDFDGSPVAGVLAQAPPLEGTIVSQCINAGQTLGTDNSGECTMDNVKVGSLRVSVQSGGIYYFTSPNFATFAEFPITTQSGQPYTLALNLAKKNMLVVHTYVHDDNDDPSNTKLNNVRLYLRGRSLVSGGNENMEISATGAGGIVGETRWWVYPGQWRITAIGNINYAGLDFVNSWGSNSGYFDFPPNSPEVVKDFYLIRQGGVKGKLYGIDFNPGPSGTPGEFDFGTADSVNNVIVSYTQSDLIVHYSDQGWGPEPQSPTSPPYARYLNNTVVNQSGYYCMDRLTDCPYWPQQAAITSSGGSYQINNVGPLIVDQSFQSPTRPEDARVWAKYYVGGYTGGSPSVTPIVYTNSATPRTRANSTFFLSYSGIWDWDVYPRNSGTVRWPLLKRIKADGLPDSNKNQDIYVLKYDRKNFLHLKGSILKPDNEGGGIFQGGTENRIKLRLWNPATSLAYDIASYVTSSGGIQRLNRSPSANPGPGNQTYSFPFVVPPLGDNALQLEYQSGGSSLTDSQYNFSVELLSNVVNGQTYVHQANLSATFTENPTIRVDALSSLGTTWETLFSQGIIVSNGSASFSKSNGRKTNNVYGAVATFTGQDELDPKPGGAWVTKDITLTSLQVTRPPHRVLIMGDSNSMYRPVLGRDDRNGNEYGLLFADSPPRYSSTLYFVLQKLMRFAGYVYDMGSATHAVPNPFVRIDVVTRQTVGLSDTVNTFTTADTTVSNTGLAACANLPCPAAPQYDVEVWVPMVNASSHWVIRVSDNTSQRYYNMESPTPPLTESTPSLYQFDFPLTRRPGFGG